jgi:hypothetical protein
MKWNGKARVEVTLYLDEENREDESDDLKEQGIDVQPTPEPERMKKRKASAESAIRTSKGREKFLTTFSEIVGNLAIVQLDVFPRGYGSVINFKSEMQEPPIWLPKDLIQE